MAKVLAPFFLAALLASVAALPASASHDAPERNLSSIGGNIVVPASGADNVSCIFCSVDVQGDVRGAVSVIGGDLTVEPGQAVNEAVSVIGGNLILREDARIGDATSLIAGELRLSPGASIRGNQSIMPSRLWLLIFLLPFVLLGGVIWLVVWLVRLNRRPPPRAV